MSNGYPIHPAAEILPLLPEIELKRLAKDIRRRGLIHPILLYQGQVVDGRNRLKACALAKVEPKFHAVDPDLDQRGITPMEYVVSLNLRRRQMSPSQQAVSAAIALPQWTAEGRKLRIANLKRGKRRADGAQVQNRGSSDKQLAKLFGVSPRYIWLAAELLKKHPVLADEVRRGECTLTRAVRRARTSQRQQRQAEETRQISRVRPLIEIRHVDITRGPLPQRRFQLIATDPPYSKNDLPLWHQLGRVAGQVLWPGGFLAALAGLQFLDQVISALAQPENGLRYFWTLCLAFDGPHGRRHGLGVNTTWRPLLVFFKPPFEKPRGQILDRFRTKLPSDPTHKWEQSPEAIRPVIENLSAPEDWVLDPFAGSGSVLECCRILGRHAVGIDADVEAINIMRQRFGLPR